MDPADYARRLVAGIEREFRRDPSVCDWQERPLLAMLNKSFEELKLENFPGDAATKVVGFMLELADIWRRRLVHSLSGDAQLARTAARAQPRWPPPRPFPRSR